MTADELNHALRQLRLGGMADTLSVRAQQARADNLGPFDFLSLLVHDEFERRRDRLVARRIKNAAFRDITTLDTFNWSFNPTIDRALIFELATGRFIERREDALILGNPGTGKSHIALGLGLAVFLGKILLLSAAVVLVETVNAKLRLFRVPDLLSAAFVLATMALLSTFIFH